MLTVTCADVGSRSTANDCCHLQLAVVQYWQESHLRSGWEGEETRSANIVFRNRLQHNSKPGRVDDKATFNIRRLNDNGWTTNKLRLIDFENAK